MGCGSSSAQDTSGQRQTIHHQTRTNTETTKKTAKSPKPTKETVKPSGSSFVDAAIKAHNHYRSEHGAPPLSPAKDLTQYSQNWANDIASRDTMEHSKCTLPSGGRIGENIYYYWSSEGATIRDSNAKDAVDAWYSEIKDYNFKSPGFKSGTGHFTQVVWKGSREMGIAAAASKSGSVYVVANYRSAGNMTGDFPGNVLALGTPVTGSGPTNNKAGSGGGHKKSSGRSFIDTAVQAHNKYRSDHHAPPMRHADDLTKYSQKWAYDIARRDTMEHSKCTLPSGGRIGENIYCYWSSDGAEISDSQAVDAVKSWYDEIKMYNFNKPGFAMKTGHFTQVVWKGSVELGIAAAVSRKGTVYVVANYRPAGNMMGDFPTSVLPKR